MFKVVIDTNLLIDGSVDDYNYGNRIVDAVIEGKVSAFANVPTLRENQLISDLKIKDAEYRKKLREFFGKIHRVDSAGIKLDLVEDPEDNKLIESAVAAKADYLLSSDRHLLRLGQYEGIKILSPEAFWAFYQEEGGAAWKQWLAQFVK